MLKIITGYKEELYAMDPRDINSGNILSFIDVDFDELVLYSRKKNMNGFFISLK